MCQKLCVPQNLCMNMNLRESFAKFKEDFLPDLMRRWMSWCFLGPVFQTSLRTFCRKRRGAAVYRGIWSLPDSFWPPTSCHQTKLGCRKFSGWHPTLSLRRRLLMGWHDTGFARVPVTHSFHHHPTSAETKRGLESMKVENPNKYQYVFHEYMKSEGKNLQT